jgi:hypothetical protein
VPVEEEGSVGFNETNDEEENVCKRVDGKRGVIHRFLDVIYLRCNKGTNGLAEDPLLSE